jgi:protoheme IX farnesyltransferase
MKRGLKSFLFITNSYIDLMKPNILIMVLITSILGYYLGSDGKILWGNLIWLLIGTTFSAGGASVLNQYLERDQDKIMKRTSQRPIPSGIISPHNALFFGIILVIIGTIILVLEINLLTGFLSLLTAFMYVLIYTPMKRITWLNTSMGSIPGALPPIGGWAAATNSIDSGAWILFGILYLWQHPHFFAIAWMCKDDYEKAGFMMLPVIEPDGKRTTRQILWHLSLLFPISLLPVVIGMNGNIYLYGALIITLYYFLSALPMLYDKSYKNASRILKASVLYLPALMIIIIIDKGI